MAAIADANMAGSGLPVHISPLLAQTFQLIPSLP